MESDDYLSGPTARQKMEARTVMANNPEFFAVPDDCADCQDLNGALEEVALEKVVFNIALAEAAQSLCAFKDACEGPLRSDDGEWLMCGSWNTPAG